MTDYNDGLWHGWNGGECPVHEKSTVCGVEENGTKWTALAGENDWQSFRGAFRVVKEYFEPYECWLVGDKAFSSAQKAKIYASGTGGGVVIHVREVLE